MEKDSGVVAGEDQYEGWSNISDDLGFEEHYQE